MGQGSLTIVGDTPLLMHNPASMLEPDEGGKNKTIPKPEEEAAAGRYLMPGSDELCLQAEHVRGSLIKASSGYRIKTPKARSLVPYISGLVDIVPEFIPLGTSEYEVDIRTTMIRGRGRIVRARPKLFPWQATMTVEFDEFLSEFMKHTFADLVGDAGRVVGLLDFRPACKGRFGRFHVESWKVNGNGKVTVKKR